MIPAVHSSSKSLRLILQYKSSLVIGRMAYAHYIVGNYDAFSGIALNFASVGTRFFRIVCLAGIALAHRELRMELRTVH